MDHSSRMLIYDGKHFVRNTLNFIDDRREQTVRNIFIDIRENKSCFGANVLWDATISSRVPWTDRVNHERLLEFKAWFSWDRWKEKNISWWAVPKIHATVRVLLVDTFIIFSFSDFFTPIFFLSSHLVTKSSFYFY